MQFSHQTAKLEGYLMLNMNLSNYNLIKYQSSIDFYFINTTKREGISNKAN